MVIVIVTSVRYSDQVDGSPAFADISENAFSFRPGADQKGCHRVYTPNPFF
jgi:hypothetical protein